LFKKRGRRSKHTTRGREIRPEEEEKEKNIVATLWEEVEGGENPMKRGVGHKQKGKPKEKRGKKKKSQEGGMGIESTGS